MSLLHYEPHGLEAIEHNGPRILFAEHHRSLQHAGQDLLCRATEDNSLALVAEFQAFQQQVLDHMRAEEELVLPAFAEVDAGEAAAIRLEHDLMRKQLDKISLDVQLHTIRIDAIRELLAVLDDHSKREDRTMYVWAQVHLPVTASTSIRARLLAAIRSLGGPS